MRLLVGGEFISYLGLNASITAKYGTLYYTLTCVCFLNSRDYLRDNPHLVREDTANYLTMWCVNLEMQDVRVSTHTHTPVQLCIYSASMPSLYVYCTSISLIH